MKVTIDTTGKTIEIEERVSIKDLKKHLNGLLGDSVDEYTIIPKQVINTIYVDRWRDNWGNPYIPYPNPYPIITFGDTSSGTTLTTTDNGPGVTYVKN